MKTAEEVAREILIKGTVALPFKEQTEAVAALIRADREELLNRVALTQHCRIDSFDNNLAAVRKEALL